jgi:transposase
MIPRGVEIFLAVEPVDLRWSFDRLSGVAASVIGRPARSGALFVFVGKRRDACKVLFFDGTGLCQFYKRLDRGVFRLPTFEPDRPTVVMEEHALEALLDGIDVEPSPRRPPRRQAARVH